MNNRIIFACVLLFCQLSFAVEILVDEISSSVLIYEGDSKISSIDSKIPDDKLRISFDKDEQSIEIIADTIFSESYPMTVTCLNGESYHFLLNYGERAFEVPHLFGEKKLQESMIDRELIRILYAKSIKGNLFKDENTGLFLEMKKIYFTKGYFYYVFELNNQSTIPYTVKAIEMFSVIKKHSEKELEQNEEFDKKPVLFNQEAPLHQVGLLPQTNERLVLSSPKRTLAENEELMIKFWEEKGERELKIIIPSSVVNDPVYVTGYKNDRVLTVNSKTRIKPTKSCVSLGFGGDVTTGLVEVDASYYRNFKGDRLQIVAGFNPTFIKVEDVNYRNYHIYTGLATSILKMNNATPFVSLGYILNARSTDQENLGIASGVFAHFDYRIRLNSYLFLSPYLHFSYYLANDVPFNDYYKIGTSIGYRF